MVTESATVAGPIRRRRRRWPRIVALALIALPVMAWLYLSWSAQHDLEEAIAEADRLDPRWRFDDILADRPPPPADDRNSAVQLGRVKTALGKSTWYLTEAEEAVFNGLAPNIPLNAAQTALLHERLDRVPQAILEARRLKDMPDGRHPIHYNPDFLSTLLGTVQDTRTAGHLLRYDILLRTQEGNDTAVVDDLCALLNAARSLHTDPMAISLLVRVAMMATTIDSLERVLAQMQLSEQALRDLQERLARELAEPMLREALRTERGGCFQGLQMVAEGKLPADYLADLNGPNDMGAVQRAFMRITPGRVSVDRASFLRLMNELVEAAKLPVEAQGPAFERVLTKWQGHGQSPLGLSRFADRAIMVEQRFQANTRCAVVALAAERYRLKHNAWPTNGNVLVKEGFLDELSKDPFDGQPLRLRRTSNGLVIYSVGRDKTDDNGNVRRDRPLDTGTDLGFRLWDVAARRRGR